MREIKCPFCKKDVRLPLPAGARNGCPNPCGCGAMVCGPTADDAEGTVARIKAALPPGHTLAHHELVGTGKKADTKFFVVFYIVDNGEPMPDTPLTPLSGQLEQRLLDTITRTVGPPKPPKSGYN